MLQEIMGRTDSLLSFDLKHPTIFRCRGNVFTEQPSRCLQAMQGGINTQIYGLSFDTVWTAQKTTRPTIRLLLHEYSLPREHVYRDVALQQ
jgi:hypothetical protein